MTAGTASSSTATQATGPNDARDPSLPFQPRTLTRGERSRRVSHVFYSPRNNRIVTVTDTINAAAATLFEFDSTLTAYIERPRRLQFSPKQQIDVAFWTRARTGEERFYVTIPDEGTIGSTSGTVSVRDPSVLTEVARRHELILHTLTEADLRSKAAWIKVCNELLLHVWEYARQPARSMIRYHIEGHLKQAPRVGVSTLLRALNYTPTAILAVIAAMVHDGSARLVDYTPGMIDAVLEACHA